MVDLLADRRLYAFYDDEASPTLDELRTRYARQSAGTSPDGRETWHNWIVRVRDTGEVAGFVQATIGATAGSSTAGADTASTPFDGASSAELAWVIGTAYQRRGYATEAVAAVATAVRGPDSLTGDDVELVHAHIAPDNVASQSVARRLGLRPTDVIVDGETRWQLPLDAVPSSATPVS
jgi:RimJ/RimL family protein N-acetyltransferase